MKNKIIKLQNGKIIVSRQSMKCKNVSCALQNCKTIKLQNNNIAISKTVKIQTVKMQNYEN